LSTNAYYYYYYYNNLALRTLLYDCIMPVHQSAIYDLVF